MKTPVLGFSGFSGSGKTTLIESLIPALKSRGLKVAVIKHDAHDFEIDREGKDTWRFGRAGADMVMISSGSKSAGINAFPKTLERMILEAEGVDLILVEGYKYADIPRIGVAGFNEGFILPSPENEYIAIVAGKTSAYSSGSDALFFDPDDTEAIAEWIMKEFLMKDGGEDINDRKELTHFDSEGNARMVNVSDKGITLRRAVAGAKVLVNRETFALIKEGGIKKGDVLTVAQIAGIMGAKRTPDLIPMCHPIIIDGADVRLKLNEEETAIDITAAVECTGRTGVEMEAICAASVAAMTVYDMCKAVQRDIVLTQIRLLSKSGGVHGDYNADPLDGK